MKNGKLRMENKIKSLLALTFAFLLLASTLCVKAQQELPPTPSAPREVKIPPVQNNKLANNLKIAVVERKNVPLVTVSLLLNAAGADYEDKDGLANATASLLTKGTKTRTATQIAEDIEFLGGNLNAGSNWNSTVVSLNVTSDKLDQAMAIMSDVVLNPTFAQSEIDLFKSQTSDELNVALKQPGSLASFVASRYTFGEHNPIGTPESLQSITKADIAKFYAQYYIPNQAVLIFAGDVSSEQANALAKKYFENWGTPLTKNSKVSQELKTVKVTQVFSSKVFNRMLVVDLPNSGQAAVVYAKELGSGRIIGKDNYFPATVTNTILGGGYSARLNEEIRIKRGLSYGAASSLAYRDSSSNLLARAQTKNVSAAEVAELVAAEIGKLGTASVEEPELTPRELTLNGAFGNSLATTNGLAARLVDLYTYGLSPDELNSYMKNVRNVSAAQVKNFAANNLDGGDMIIVGDYKVFADDLKKRFPNQKIEVIPASDLDLNSATLMKK